MTEEVKAAKSSPNRSSPLTVVIHFRLLRVTFSITTSCFSYKENIQCTNDYLISSIKLKVLKSHIWFSILTNTQIKFNIEAKRGEKFQTVTFFFIFPPGRRFTSSLGAEVTPGIHRHHSTQGHNTDITQMLITTARTI